MIGKTLGHYKILEQLGRGGMGEVYLADDTTLDRKVALKFLPDVFTGDPERMARFEREAKLLASLNHPNIAAIYGLEQADGKRFLIMEYVEGETVQTRISKGALPLEEALGICKQIAEGLEAAHEKGVIHRDLKPANVMITGEEKVKILDFGLAKALSDEIRSVDSSQSPTITEAMTQPGVVLGTAAYMSPEQAKGKAVDKRADIWAFGCILYECLTGKRVFEGETVTETLAAVIKEVPDLERAPIKARLLLRKCLAKDRKYRLRDIGDAMALIESEPYALEAVTVRRPWLAWIIALICLVGALALGVLYFQKIPAEMPVTRLQIVTPPTSTPTSFAISPDGRSMVFVASSEGQQMLWLRLLDGVTARPLPGTEDAKNPFWSPNSKSIGFFAERKLKRIDISDGQIQELASVFSGYGGTWSSSGVIVFAPSYNTPLYRIPDIGGDKVAITKLDRPRQESHQFPQFLPDGRRLLFHSLGPEPGVYLTSLDSTETKHVITTELPAFYAAPGYLLFMRETTLFVQRFDAKRGQVLGSESKIADSISVASYYAVAGFSASETGMLAYRTGLGFGRRKLAWFDRKGNELEALGAVDEGNPNNPELSPNGNFVAVERNEESNDIWIIDIARGIHERFTSDPGYDCMPVWSHDGSKIFFGSDRREGFKIYRKNSNGVGKEELISKSSLTEFAIHCSPDGKYLLHSRIDPNVDNRDIWVLPLSGEEEPFPFTETEFHERSAQFSPNGRWVAYQSDQSGEFEIYVKPFPGPGGNRRISNSGGLDPRWHPDGNELFFVAPDGRMMAVPIQTEKQTLEIAPEVELFHPKIVRPPLLQKPQYVVADDGRFLINIEVEETTSSPITIVTNWISLLDKK